MPLSVPNPARQRLSGVNTPQRRDEGLRIGLCGLDPDLAPLLSNEKGQPPAGVDCLYQQTAYVPVIVAGGAIAFAPVSMPGLLTSKGSGGGGGSGSGERRGGSGAGEPAASGGDLGPGWRPRDINDPNCWNGCEAVARDIQKRMGGELRHITPKTGLFLGEYRGSEAPWGYHDVVVREGRVYDAFTERTGLPIDQYKALWKYADMLNFGF
jgi:hypothetical protein